MNEIKFKEFSIKELVDLYTTSNKIISDITLQRSIVYSDDKQRAVIDTIYNNLVLPTLIFWEIDNGVYEVIDGKQRLHSITRYVQGALTYDDKTIKELSQIDEKKVEEFKNKKIYVQIHSGNENEKRESFYRINTSGIPLNNYEIINGLMKGTFIDELNSFVKDNKDMEKIFNEPNNRGKYQYEIFKRITKKSSPTAIVKEIENIIEKEHSDSFNKLYASKFRKELKFILSIFPTNKKSKFEYLNTLWDIAEQNANEINIFKQYDIIIKSHIKEFLENKELKKLLSSKEIDAYIWELIETIKLQNPELNKQLDKKRFFSSFDKKALLDNYKDYEKQIINEKTKYQCKHCLMFFDKDDLEIDHITPWSKGGQTDLTNAQLLCKSCNVKKSNK